jgi:hypothetical protein
MTDGSEKWVNNFLNFRVENFNVSESGSLADIIESQSQVFELNQSQNRTEQTL